MKCDHPRHNNPGLTIPCPDCGGYWTWSTGEPPPDGDFPEGDWGDELARLTPGLALKAAADLLSRDQTLGVEALQQLADFVNRGCGDLDSTGRNCVLTLLCCLWGPPGVESTLREIEGAVERAITRRDRTTKTQGDVPPTAADRPQVDSRSAAVSPDGPWEFVRLSDGYAIVGVGIVVAHGISSLYDARVIAAAPQLLAACRAVVELGDPGPCLIACQQAIDAAETTSVGAGCTGINPGQDAQQPARDASD